MFIVYIDSLTRHSGQSSGRCWLDSAVDVHDDPVVTDLLISLSRDHDRDEAISRNIGLRFQMSISINSGSEFGSSIFFRVCTVQINKHLFFSSYLYHENIHRIHANKKDVQFQESLVLMLTC